MIADLLLRLLGENPSHYYPEDKWPFITAFLEDQIVPYGQIILFILPFAIILWRKWKFSPRNIIIAVAIGGLLAWGAWWLDWWLLAWGQAAAFRSLYGDSINDF